MKSIAFSVVAVLVLVPAPVAAQEQSLVHSQQAPLPTIELVELLNEFAQRENTEFLVDHRVRTRVTIGALGTNALSDADLHVILRNNDLAAVTIDDTVNIVPVAIVRQFALPVVTNTNADYASEQWVTATFTPEHADATMFVPILRPIIPAAGHFAAHKPTNSVLIVDRYDNVKRLIAIMQRLDEVAKRRKD